MTKGSAAQRQVESRLYVSRPLQFEPSGVNPHIEVFVNKVGRAIKGMGRTRAMGSMAVTLLSAQAFSQVRNNLPTRDRSRLSSNLDDFAHGLEQVLKERPTEAQLTIRGLGFYGRNPRSQRPGAWTTFGFNAAPHGNDVLRGDIDAIKTYFSDNHLPEPTIDPKKLHLSAGEVQIFRLATGKAMDKNDGPSVFIPAGVSIPHTAELQAPHAETIDG